MDAPRHELDRGNSPLPQFHVVGTEESPPGRADQLELRFLSLHAPVPIPVRSCRLRIPLDGITLNLHIRYWLPGCHGHHEGRCRPMPAPLGYEACFTIEEELGDLFEPTGS